MNNKYYSSVIWGTGMYAFIKFIDQPDQRLQIIACIVIAFFIYSANQLIMTDFFYRHKVLRYLVPLAIMNVIIVPINVIITKINGGTFSSNHIWYYSLFNIVVLIIYILQHQYQKQQINKYLKLKQNSFN